MVGEKEFNVHESGNNKVLDIILDGQKEIFSELRALNGKFEAELRALNAKFEVVPLQAKEIDILKGSFTALEAKCQRHHGGPSIWTQMARAAAIATSASVAVFLMGLAAVTLYKNIPDVANQNTQPIIKKNP